MTDFSALHVALSGLRAARYGTETGSRDVSKVRMDSRLRTISAGACEVSARSKFLERAELVMGEPDHGISTELGRFFVAFEDLGLDPSSTAYRVAALQQLEILTSRVNGVYQGIEDLRADAMHFLIASIAEVNQLLTQMGALGIVDVGASGGTPNDLMDGQDKLADRLAELVGAGIGDEGNGSVRVALGGIALVAGADVRTLSVDVKTAQVVHPSGVAVTPGGEARGLQLAFTTDLPALEAKLDEFAVDLASAFNGIHATGYCPSDIGGDLVNHDSGAPALTLRRQLTDPHLLATAASAGPPFPAFDGAIPNRFALLRGKPVASGGTASLPAALNSIVTALGRDTASLGTTAETQTALVRQAERSRMAADGGSIDEEVVSLMEFRRIYESAARVSAGIDQALRTVISRIGVIER